MNFNLYNEIRSGKNETELREAFEKELKTARETYKKEANLNTARTAAVRALLDYMTALTGLKFSKEDFDRIKEEFFSMEETLKKATPVSTNKSDAEILADFVKMFY